MGALVLALAGLAFLDSLNVLNVGVVSALHPRPPLWPLVIVAYWAIALSPPLLILALSLRRTVRVKRIQRRLVRALTRYGPISVRLLFLVFGIGLVADALVNHSALW